MAIKKISLAGAVLAFSTSHAMAFTPPSNVECIAPSGPGGGLDFICRSIGRIMGELDLVSGSVPTTNMPGGGQGVGYAYASSKRKGDQSVFFAGSTGTTTRLGQGQFPGLTTDSVKWVGALGAEYGVIAVPKDSPYQNLQQLLDDLRKNPASVSFAGGSGAGGDDNLKILRVANKAGISNLNKIKYLSFNGGGEALTQVVGNHVDAFLGDASEAMGFYNSGDLRILAILGDERIDELPDVPTAKEQGVDVVARNFRGIYVPQNISDESYEWWIDTMNKVYESDEWKKAMNQNGLVDFHMTGQEFTEFVNSQAQEVHDLSVKVGLMKQ